MASEAVNRILKTLRKIGVEFTDEIEAEAKDKLDELVELAPADSVLADGEMAVKREEYREIKDDLTKLRSRAKDAEKERDDLKRLLDSGESRLAKENALLQKKLNDVEPIHNQLLEQQRKRWEQIAESIPESAQTKFTFPQGDGETLADKEVIANLARYDEYKELGVPGFDGKSPELEPAPDHPKGAPSGPGPKGGPKDLTGKDAGELMEEGYGKVAKNE